MFEDVCVWYLKRQMRKYKALEMVISEESKYYRKRNIEREKSVKETLSKIK